LRPSFVRWPANSKIAADAGHRVPSAKQEKTDGVAPIAWSTAPPAVTIGDAFGKIVGKRIA
jgi:hypothetical protein